MNPRQRRLRRQRRKDRNEAHEQAVEEIHALKRASTRLAAQVESKRVQAECRASQAIAAPLTGGALLSSVFAGIKT